MIKDNLPNDIAVFPLSNAVFFPRTILPLNIFETRYIQLVNDCMKSQRLFGMVQPKIRSGNKPKVYKIGCLGKIVNFKETIDKRFIITLSGIIRFKIEKELDSNKLYRIFNVNYSDFLTDLEEKNSEIISYDKNILLKKIKKFFEKENYSVKFNELQKLSFDQLINTTCMISPFSVQEKQKLIETIDIKDKLTLLEEIINFNLADLQQHKTIQ